MLFLTPIAPYAPASVPVRSLQSLQFLSVVETARIPLYIAVGPQYDVSTEDSEPERWFSSILLGHRQCAQDAWWDSASLESPLGILCSTRGNVILDKGAPRVTEVLFFASKSDGRPSERPPTPPPSSPSHHAASDAQSAKLVVRAIALSSDLIVQQSTLSTPPSPTAGDKTEIDAVFLPSRFVQTDEPIHEPPVKKRKSVNDTLDEAAERRKKARRKGGEGVAAAVAAKVDSQVPTLNHRRTVSGGQSVPLQTRPLSRSPSISTSRPPSVRGISEAPKRSSTLARVQSLSGVPEEQSLEDKNRDVVSRIVMAGMRLYGMSQSKSRKARAGSAAQSPAVDITFEDQDVDRRQDEEYKLVYHQVFKGVCFAFRQHIATTNLQPFTEALRDATDKLLAIYCSDPLEAGLIGAPDKLTPGGRKAFASAHVETKSPFLGVSKANDENNLTPGSRKRNHTNEKG